MRSWPSGAALGTLERCPPLQPSLWFLLKGFRHAALHNAQRLPVQSASTDAPAGQLTHRLAHAERQTSVRYFQNVGHDN